MKIICAPDSFKESISAVSAARAMARGILENCPDATVDICPVGDGGEGTLDAMLESIPGTKRHLRACGALGEPVEACYGLFAGDGQAYVESAEVIGLQTIPAGKRSVLKASSYGVGEILLAVSAAERITIGVGGSATNDGGCGMAQAIGCRFLDSRGIELAKHLSGEMLGRIARIDVSGVDSRLADCSVDVASDVTNPLTGPYGAARVFAPQKGAGDDEVEILEAGLQHLAALFRRDLGADIEMLPGAGAAGGLAGGLVAFAGAEIRSGIQTVLETIDFDERIRTADLCLTGEGRLDAQTLSGKACIGVARAAARHGVPTVALVGSIGDGASRALDAGLADYVVIGEGLGQAYSMACAGDLLSAAAGKTVRDFLSVT